MVDAIFVPSTGHVRNCPYCHNSAQFNREANAEFYCYPDPMDRTTAMQRVEAAVYKCVVCGNPLSVHAWGRSEQQQQVYPHFIPDAADEIPQKVRSVYLEALCCLGVKAWNATATMCRRAVQECVVDRGGKGRDLYAQIEHLAKVDVIAPDLRDWAHAVRVVGKNGAHADVFTDVTESDARDAMQFTEELLKYVYILKARYQKMRTVQAVERPE